MEHTHKKFLDLASKKFGDKVQITSIKVEESVEEIEQRVRATKEEIEAYPKQAWLKETKCPNCDAELMGLFGMFQWGIAHGIGFCGKCKKVDFKFYHYIGKGKIDHLAIVGFSD